MMKSKTMFSSSKHSIADASSPRSNWGEGLRSAKYLNLHRHRLGLGSFWGIGGLGENKLPIEKKNITT